MRQVQWIPLSLFGIGLAGLKCDSHPVIKCKICSESSGTWYLGYVSRTWHRRRVCMLMGTLPTQLEIMSEPETYLGGTVTETPDMSVEIARRTSACWARIRRYSRELYGQPKVALSLKTRMVKAEAIEALLYGCSTWTLRQEHYAKLRTVHHRVLLRIIGAQRKRPDHRMTSYNRALEITGCESIETMLRTRRLLWAGTLLRMSGGRFPKRIMFGNLEGAVRRGRGGKEKEWTDCVQSDIRAFGITGDWETMAVKAEVWVEAVTKGGRRFMAAWRQEEEDAARHRQEKREATRLGKLQSHTEA